MLYNVTCCLYDGQVYIDVPSVGYMLRSGVGNVKMWNGKL